MAQQPTLNSTANSGIRKLSNGESVIPASTRADGTVRKEIRVKPGYRPPEDVEVYKNRTAEAWKNRGKGGIPGAEKLESGQKDAASASSTAANKNAKRREARKKAALAAHGGTENVEGVITHDATTDDTPGPNGQSEVPREDAEGLEAETAQKEARKLSKKLRQAMDLQAKQDGGDNLLPEQLAKVIKINELTRQLDKLGFTSDGERKSQERAEDGAE